MHLPRCRAEGMQAESEQLAHIRANLVHVEAHLPGCLAHKKQPPPPCPGEREMGVESTGYRVQGSWFRVHGSWFMVHGSWFMVQGSGFRVQGSGFRVQGSKEDLGHDAE